MNINAIKKLFREIKESVPVNRTTYKTLNGLEIVRNELRFSKDEFYGFRLITIHYVLVSSTGGRVLKKITKICFKDGDAESLGVLFQKLGVKEMTFKTGKNIFREAFTSYFSYTDHEVSINGGLHKESGCSEVTCSFRNIEVNKNDKLFLNDLAESELMNILKANTTSEKQKGNVIEVVKAIKESHHNRRNYFLYHYLPIFPEKGKGFNSIAGTQDVTYLLFLETLDFFYGPKGNSWKPNNEGNVKEIYEYKGRHTVYWTHAVRKLFSPEMICFAGTSLLPKERPVVECEILYEMA